MEGSRGKKYRILMVDDDESLLEIGSLFMEKFGFRVYTSTSGQEALSLISSNKFDAIISDFQMPGMNGLELLKSLRANGYDIPFIMLTGHGSEEIASDALNMEPIITLSKKSMRQRSMKSSQRSCVV